MVGVALFMSVSLYDLKLILIKTKYYEARDF